jgi:queuosine precursor transporter
VLIFSFTIGALRLGKEALIAWIALQSVLANLFVFKQTTLFSFQATCSDVFILGVMLGLNLLQEYFGVFYARRAMFLSFSAMMSFVVLAKMHLFYQAHPSDWSQDSYDRILSHSPRVLVASLVTFFLVQQFDVRFYGWLRRKFHGLHLAWRTTLSIILAQGIDTVLFTMLGLSGVVDNLFSIILMSFFIKVVIAICSAPFTMLSKKLLPIKPEGVI